MDMVSRISDNAGKEMPPAPQPPFLPMGIAQLQALGFLGYPPGGTPFQGLNFIPPGLLQKSHLTPVTQEHTCHNFVTSDSDEALDTQKDLPTNSDMDSTQYSGCMDNHKPPRLTQSNDPDRKPVLNRTCQKRQAIQDMTRPLKQWLYGHRDNPYPNKSEKVQLARTSLMTMTQVSNWFANARRRLKNTVRGPNMTWAKRIKLYNNHVEGNQEILSTGSTISSEEDNNDDCEGELSLSDSGRCQHAVDFNSHQGNSQDLNIPELQSNNRHTGPEVVSPVLEKQSVAESCEQGEQCVPALPTTPADSHNQHLTSVNRHDHQLPGDSTTTEENIDRVSSPPKYKHSIMQRYLNDSWTYQTTVQSLNTSDPKEKERQRNPSGSLSSHDYEEYMSSASSSRSTPTREHLEGHFDEYERFSKHWPDIKNRAEEDLYWKEISAALALTSLARSKYNQGQMP